MRLFVALEIPAGARRAVAEVVARERRGLPRARWVRPEILHLTLLFLGETDPGRLPELNRALGEAFAAHPPFPMAVAGAGCFPPRRPARVAWLGIEAGSELAALRRDVARAGEEVLGLEPERRPFHPHLTLARCKEPWPRDAVERFRSAFDGRYGEPFTVARGVLLESHLGPGGPRYEERRAYALAATSGAREAAEGGEG